MRIQVINHRDWLNPRTGGVEEVVRQTCTRWAAAGHDVRLLVSNFVGAKERDFVADGVTIMRRGREETFNWTAPIRYRQLFAQADVNVEHLSKVACMLPWYTQRPVIGYVHHLFGRSILGNIPLPIAAYVIAMEKIAMRVYRRCPFIAVSHSTADDLARHGVSRVHVAYNGVNGELFRPPDGDVKTAHPSVLWVGRVRKTKCVSHVVEAFGRLVGRLPSAHLTIVGTGDYAEELRRLIARKQLQRQITMTGYLSETAMRDHMQRAWVLAYPSPKEGWGLCVTEAAACGTPSVASNSPGLREAVRDGVTGFLVPHGDIGALADQLLVLLQDAKLRAQMSQAALQWAARFSWEQTARQTLEVITAAASQTNHDRIQP